MAYKLMLNLIKNGKKTKERLAKMANVYYAAGQLNDTEYEEVIALIYAEETEEYTEEI